METQIRVLEFAFATPEQRRSVAESLVPEIDGGCRVIGMVPVSLRQDAEGDLMTVRIAVYLEGATDDRGGEEAMAATAIAEPETEAIAEQISSIPVDDGEQNPLR